ncbi:MAG: DUF1761 domain-containing protein [Saprospiraceae bacterium]
MGILPFFLAALIPMIVGALYYSPPVAGNAWMKTNGFTKESLEGGNMALILGLSYVFALLLTLPVYQMSVHQTGFESTLAMIEGFGVPGSDIQNYIDSFMELHGDRHRTFGHGVLHGGLIGGLGIALPLIGINALFERRGWKYIVIHLVYWMITLGLMGGVLCQFAMRS